MNIISFNDARLTDISDPQNNADCVNLQYLNAAIANMNFGLNIKAVINSGSVSISPTITMPDQTASDHIIFIPVVTSSRYTFMPFVISNVFNATNPDIRGIYVNSASGIYAESVVVAKKLGANKIQFDPLATLNYPVNSWYLIDFIR